MIAVDPVPDTDACSQPVVGHAGPDSGDGGTSGGGGAPVGASVTVQPLRAMVPVVMPLLKSSENDPARSAEGFERARSRTDGMLSLSTTRRAAPTCPAASPIATSNTSAPPAGTGKPTGTAVARQTPF